METAANCVFCTLGTLNFALGLLHMKYPPLSHGSPNDHELVLSLQGKGYLLAGVGANLWFMPWCSDLKAKSLTCGLVGLGDLFVIATTLYQNQVYGFEIQANSVHGKTALIYCGVESLIFLGLGGYFLFRAIRQHRASRPLSRRRSKPSV